MSGEDLQAVNSKRTIFQDANPQNANLEGEDLGGSIFQKLVEIHHDLEERQIMRKIKSAQPGSKVKVEAKLISGYNTKLLQAAQKCGVKLEFI